MTTTYGTVYDSNTAEPIAPATEAELRASLTSGTVEGHFDRDGVTFRYEPSLGEWVTA